MVTAAGACAVLLYLVPTFMMLWARSTRDRSIGDIALDIPVALAVDLLAVLCLARLMLLDYAIWTTRSLWLLGAGAWWLFRRRQQRQPRWPLALQGRELWIIGVAMLTAYLLSMAVSRECQNADREWHIPLVASLRGQRLPFKNVYDAAPLYYHYTGDVLAAIMQSLSLGVIHSSYALSLARDVLFASTGVTLALLLRACGWRSAALTTAGAFAVLLTGPISMLRSDGYQTIGYSFTHFVSLSLRPHVCIAGLLIIGFVGSVLVRWRQAQAAVETSTVPLNLFPVTAALALTDEAAIGLLGLSLGVAWLIHPGVVHPDRKRGVVIFAFLLIALVSSIVLFGATFGAGAPEHDIDWVPWRAPGYRFPVLLLRKTDGRDALFHDIGGLVLLGLAVWVARRRGGRSSWAPALFATTLLACSVVALTRVEFDHDPLENHRVMTAAQLTVPLVALFTVIPWDRTVRGQLATAMVMTAVLLGAGSSLAWVQGKQRIRCMKAADFFTNEDFFATNCRRLGAHLGEQTKPRLAETKAFYAFAGCRPLFTSGPPPAKHKLQVGFPVFGQRGLRALHEHLVKADESLELLCLDAKGKDPLCVAARQRGCTDVGRTSTSRERLVSCMLDPAERARLVPPVGNTSRDQDKGDAPAKPGPSPAGGVGEFGPDVAR